MTTSTNTQIYQANDIWEFSQKWAEENDLTTEFELIINTFQLRHFHINGLGTVVAELIGDNTIQILRIWKETDYVANILYKFAIKARSDEALVENYPALPRGKSAKTLFSGNLRKLSLLGMILHPISDRHNEEGQKLSNIRLWIMYQAFLRAAQGYPLDKNISKAASYLTGVNVSVEHEKLNFLFSIFGETVNPESDIQLSSIKKRINGIPECPPPGGRNHTKIFNALKGIAIGEIIQFDENLNTGEPKRLGFFINMAEKSQSEFTPKKDEEDWSSINFIKSPEGSDDENIVEVDVQEEDSYVHQRLSQNSTILSTKEQLQFLKTSWANPTDFETDSLNAWIEELSKSEEIESRIFSLYAWIAIHAGRSLARAIDIEIDSKPGREWRLCPSNLNLHRIPPARTGQKAVSDHQKEWVREYAERIEIRLREEFIKITKLIVADNHKFETIGQYWELISKIPPSKFYNDNRPSSLQRVTPGMLGNILSLRIYDETGNANLTRLIASHPQSGLPGAFAYGNWDLRDVDQLLNPDSPPDTEIPSNVIGMGSAIDPLESMLQDEIARISTEFEIIRNGNDPIKFHNWYTAILKSALDAGCGARAISDNFESIRQFDLDNHFVYLNDKTKSDEISGRLSPLPRVLCDILKKEYPTHLTYLAFSLEKANPRLANEIKVLAAGKHNSHLPYLFLISEENLDWLSISNKNIDSLEIFRWPLPHNLFRHRFIKQLCRIGVEQEVIDAWSDHAELDAQTYGDFSIRCFLDDLDSYQHKIDHIYQRLGFPDFTTWTKPPEQITGFLPIFTQKTFGAQFRKENRLDSMKKDIKRANQEIADFFYRDEYSDLEESIENATNETIDELINMLMFHENGLPRNNGYLRYRVFEKITDRIYKKSGVKTKLRKRAAWKREKSPFSSKTPDSLKLIEETRKIFEIITAGEFASRVAKDHIPFEICLSLIFENNLTYRKLLDDVSIGKNCRLVIIGEKLKLEYSEKLEKEDFSTPVQRHVISKRLAVLIDRAISWPNPPKKREVTSDNNIRNLGQLLNIDLPGSGKVHYEKLITELCDYKEKVNQIRLPGIIAAHTSGRVASTSLNWWDEIRIHKNRILNLRCDNNDRDKFISPHTLDEIIKLNEKPRSSVLKTTDSETLQKNAYEFKRKISSILKKYINTAKGVEVTKKALKNINSEYLADVSNTLLLITDWIIHLLETGYKGKRYAPNTIYGYFKVIANTFTQIAYNIDIRSFGSDELTVLYNQFLEVNEDKKDDYYAKRLLQFHRFLSRQGIENPIWEELDMPDSERSVSPGIITETEYIDALLLLNSLKSFDLHERDRLSFILVLCYRFGLRATEAIRIRRNEWVDTGNIIYLVIKPHYHISVRKILKSKASRRIVPLLFELTDLEQQIITRHLHRFKLTHSSDNDELFAEDNERIVTDTVGKSTIIIKTLKAITGNPHIVLHHARHTFSNITSPVLYHHAPNYWENLAPSKNDDRIRSVVLGNQTAIAKRNTMAAARLLGHSHPKVDARNYQHFITDWADRYVYFKPLKTLPRLDNVINVDNFETSERISTTQIEITRHLYKKPTIYRLFFCSGIVSAGHSFEQARQASQLSPKIVNKFKDLITLVGSIQWLSAINGYHPDVGDDPLGYLKRIPHHSWRNMFDSIDFNKGLPNIDSFDIDYLPYLIGMHRQLILTKEIHFLLAQEFIKYFEIKKEDYDVFYQSANPSLLMWVKQHNFSLSKSQKLPQPDAAYKPTEFGRRPETDRINIAFKKGEVFYTSYEYALAFVIFLICIQINQP